VDKDIGSASQPNEGIRTFRVTGDDDGTIGGIEPVSERWADRRMIDKSTRYNHSGLTDDRSPLCQLVRLDQRSEGNSTFVGRTSADIVFIQLKEQFRHSRKRRRSISIDSGSQSGSPSGQQQWAVLAVVVRMVVCDKNMAERGQGNVRADKLYGHANATVKDISGVIYEHNLRAGETRLSRSWSSNGPKQNKPRF
jgi:hypothetical protein